MKRKLRILGLSMAVAAVLALAIVGTVGAAGNDTATGTQTHTNTQTQNRGADCLCGQGPCGDCEPINHAYNHDYSYSSPGPHGFQNGK